MMSLQKKVKQESYKLTRVGKCISHGGFWYQRALLTIHACWQKHFQLILGFGLTLFSELVHQHRPSMKHVKLDQYKHTFRKYLHQPQYTMNVVLKLEGFFQPSNACGIYIVRKSWSNLAAIVVVQLQKYHFGSRQSPLCICLTLLICVPEQMHTGILLPGSTEAALPLLQSSDSFSDSQLGILWSTFLDMGQ